jgi:hypothetical protein
VGAVKRKDHAVPIMKEARASHEGGLTITKVEKRTMELMSKGQDGMNRQKGVGRVFRENILLMLKSGSLVSLSPGRENVSYSVIPRHFVRGDGV